MIMKTQKNYQHLPKNDKVIEGIPNKQAKIINILLSYHSPILLFLNGIQQIGFVFSIDSQKIPSPYFYYVLLLFQVSFIVLSIVIQLFIEKEWIKFIYRLLFHILLTEYSLLLSKIDPYNIQMSVQTIFLVKSIRDTDSNMLQKLYVFVGLVYIGLRTAITGDNAEILYTLVIVYLMSFLLGAESSLQMERQESRRTEFQENTDYCQKYEKRDENLENSNSKQSGLVRKVNSRNNTFSTYVLRQNNSSHQNCQQSHFAAENQNKLQKSNLIEFNDCSQINYSSINLMNKSLYNLPQTHHQENIKSNISHTILNALQNGLVLINESKQLLFSNDNFPKFFKKKDSTKAYNHLLNMTIKNEIFQSKRFQKNTRYNTTLTQDRATKMETSFSEIQNNFTLEQSILKNSRFQDDLKTSNYDTTKQVSHNLLNSIKQGKSISEDSAANKILHLQSQQKLQKLQSLVFDQNQKPSKQQLKGRSSSLDNKMRQSQQNKRSNVFLADEIINDDFQDSCYRLKQQIIPLSVLDVFKNDHITIQDLIDKIVNSISHNKKTRFHSTIELQNTKSESNSEQNHHSNKREENKINLKKVYNLKNKFTNKINYYIERNNLIINLNKREDSYQYLQLKFAIYQKSRIKNNRNNFQDPYFYDDHYILIEIADHSQIQQIIQERDVDEYKNRMLSSVSHELRTPLNCSIQMLEMIQLQLTSEQQIKMQFRDDQQLFISNLSDSYIKPALLSNQLLLNIINDILDYSQINQGYLHLVFQPFKIIQLMTECAEMIHLQATLKGLTIELNLDSNLPEIINSDRNRIRQILLNLLSNSLKFTESGYIHINVINESDALIRIDVLDSGIGIPQENLKEVLECFGNKSKQRMVNTQGAGLGLSIANSLAQGIGGNRKIKVESKENEGTIFSFYVVNKSMNKKGCQLYLKDIFNKKVMKWESVTNWDYLISSPTNSFHQGLIQASKNSNGSQTFTDSKAQSMLKDNQETNGMTDSCQQKSISVSNNLITISLKPNQKMVDSNYVHKKTSTIIQNPNSSLKIPQSGKKSSTSNEIVSNSRGNNGEEKYINDMLKQQKIDIRSLNIRYGISSNLQNNTTDVYDSCLVIEENSKEAHFPPNESFIRSAIIKQSKAFKSMYSRQDTPTPNLSSSNGSIFNQLHSIDLCISQEEKKEFIKQPKDLSHYSGSQKISSNLDKQIKASQLTQKYIESSQIILNENKNDNVLKQFISFNKRQSCNCPTILVVDDNDFNLYVLFLRLQTYGFIIDKASSGDKAIEKIKQKFVNSTCCKQYKLVFMDIDMPGKDGNETTILINQFYKNNKIKPSPISACTAYVQEEEIMKAYESGMKYYVTKPINQRELENVLISVFQYQN